MKKIKFILIVVLSVCLLSGCGENAYSYPGIVEYGKSDWTTDDIHIEVVNAKAGLQGYEILEEDNTVKVILTYDKR